MAALYGPDGDTVSPTMQSDGTKTFVAAEQGIYKAVLTTSIGAKPQDTQWISVLTDLHFAPDVWIPITENLSIVDTRAIVAHDLDGDGKSDLVVSEDSALEIYFGATDTLTGPVLLPGTDGGAIAVGDLSGDGRADIAVRVAGGLAVFVQRLDGSFAESVTIATDCSTRKTAPVIADLNGDGRNDLAAEDCNAVAYFLQNSDGSLDALRTVPTERSGIELAAGDLNGDGVGDLVFASDGGIGVPNIGLLYGQLGSGPQPPQFLAYAKQHGRVPTVAVADVTRDGRDDLVIAARAWSTGTDHDRVHVYHQTAGQLVAAQTIDLPYPRRSVYGVTLGDFNNDGALDIAALKGQNFSVNYHLVDGRFGGEVRAALPLPHAAGDFNGDGLTDTVFRSLESRRAIGIMFGAEVAP
jgi:hypothetical protein